MHPMLSSVPARMVIAHVRGAKILSCTRPYLNLKRPSHVAEVSTIERVRSVPRVLLKEDFLKWVSEFKAWCGLSSCGRVGSKIFGARLRVLRINDRHTSSPAEERGFFARSSERWQQRAERRGSVGEL